MATPAFAWSATITNLKASCNAEHKVCFDFDVRTSGFNGESRDVLVKLIDDQQNTLETKTVHLTSSTPHVHGCFDSDISTAKALTVKIEPQGNDLELEGSLSVDTHGCVAPTPTPTATPTAPPTATPTATPAAAALASTGGFDFRFPLVGLTVLVGGLALLLVSLSRGRSPSK